MTRVELITVGDELLSGLVLNSNVARVADSLASVGLGLSVVCDVSDDLDEIVAAVRAAAARADVVLCSGGLGPTSDDLTRDALARAAGVGLDVDAGVVQSLADRYAEWNIPMPELALRQADVPHGATLIPNPRGSAPGLQLRIDGALVLALPGVPGELQAMLDASVAPLLADLAPGPRPVTATLRVALVGESAIAAALAEIQRAGEATGVRFAYLADSGDVRVRLSGPAEAVAATEGAIVDAVGHAVYSRDGAPLEAVTQRLLLEAGATVAVAESLTGGLLGAALTDLPGSSAVFLGGVLVYATAAKADLGVDAALLAERGPVDADVAIQLAERVREKFGADYGLATTGVAGPDPVGDYPPGAVFLALAGPNGAHARRRDLPPRRDFVRRLTVLAALDLLRRELLGLPRDA
ncbi:CinA family nicotinamide mononucleotide deamidase-related protein [Sporichthya polymorpha]|uniref:CinA family nicotinamide mononucleotide deamidase-related protein n=1 Tax=Sporichthya polymorpha TaxID=35751 RepID=UPI00037CA515|nr:CinA family nicotinamide mononucleotide deamidase-related protein [Sporichthya polymorpha]